MCGSKLNKTYEGSPKEGMHEEGDTQGIMAHAMKAVYGNYIKADTLAKSPLTKQLLMVGSTQRAALFRQSMWKNCVGNLSCMCETSQ